MNMRAFGCVIPEYRFRGDFRQLQPERFIKEIDRGPRENNTRKTFVPIAMNSSLRTINRWKTSLPRPQPATIQPVRHWPSTLQMNRSNVKRKAAARGRAR